MRTIHVEFRIYVEHEVYHLAELIQVPGRGDYVVLPDYEDALKQRTYRVADITWTLRENTVVVGVDPL